MKLVVGLCAVLPFTGRPLLTGPWLLNSITLTAFTAGNQTKMDRSFQSCTTEHVHQQRQNGCFQDRIQRSNRVWICCCRLMKRWLIMGFLHKICTRPIGRLVGQFYSSLGCFYLSGTTGPVVSSNTVVMCLMSHSYLRSVVPEASIKGGTNNYIPWYLYWVFCFIGFRWTVLA